MCKQNQINRQQMRKKNDINWLRKKMTITGLGVRWNNLFGIYSRRFKTYDLITTFLVDTLMLLTNPHANLHDVLIYHCLILSGLHGFPIIKWLCVCVDCQLTSFVSLLFGSSDSLVLHCERQMSSISAQSPPVWFCFPDSIPLSRSLSVIHPVVVSPSLNQAYYF